MYRLNIHNFPRGVGLSGGDPGLSSVFTVGPSSFAGEERTSDKGLALSWSLEMVLMCPYLLVVEVHSRATVVKTNLTSTLITVSISIL